MQVSIAAFDKEGLLHALAQVVLARPVGVCVEEGKIVARLSVALPQPVPVDQLAGDADPVTPFSKSAALSKLPATSASIAP